MGEMIIEELNYRMASSGYFRGNYEFRIKIRGR